VIRIVLAMTQDGFIARPDGRLPVHDREDLRAFRAMTMGTDCVVGRVTADTLPPLPGRRLLVMSRSSGLPDVAAVLRERRPGVPLSVIGGAQVYELFADIADAWSVTTLEMRGGPGWIGLGPRMREALGL